MTKMGIAFLGFRPPISLLRSFPFAIQFDTLGSFGGGNPVTSILE